MSKRKLTFRAGGLLFTFQVKKLRCSLPLLPSHPSASLGTRVLSSQCHCNWSLKGHHWTPICQVIFLPQTSLTIHYPQSEDQVSEHGVHLVLQHAEPVGSALSHIVYTSVHTIYCHPSMSVLTLFLHPGILLCLFYLLTFMHPLKFGLLVTISPQCPSQNDVFFLYAPQHFTVKTGSHFFTLPWSVLSYSCVSSLTSFLMQQLCLEYLLNLRAHSTVLPLHSLPWDLHSDPKSSTLSEPQQDSQEKRLNFALWPLTYPGLSWSGTEEQRLFWVLLQSLTCSLQIIFICIDSHNLPKSMK